MSLLAAISSWGEANRIETFFRDVEARIGAVPGQDLAIPDSAKRDGNLRFRPGVIVGRIHLTAIHPWS